MASPRAITLLLIDNDTAYRDWLSAELGQSISPRIQVLTSQNEARTLERQSIGGVDVVVLGGGVAESSAQETLTRLRDVDPYVSIIALADTMSEEHAADGLRLGVDDIVAKEGLTVKELIQRVSEAFERSEAVRLRALADQIDQLALIEPLFFEAATHLHHAITREVLGTIDSFELAARRVKLSVGELERLYKKACREFDQKRVKGQSISAGKRLRPLMLELMVRLFSEGEVAGGFGASPR